MSEETKKPRAKGVPNPKRIRTKAEKRRARRIRIAKVAACAVVLAVAFVLALMVGDADYNATAIGWAPFVAIVAAIVGAFAYLQVLKRCLVLEEASESAAASAGRWCASAYGSATAARCSSPASRRTSS